MQRVTDSELFRLMSQDDEKALAELYKRYCVCLLGSATKELKSRAEAQEVLQDTFIRLWKIRKDYESIEAPPAFIKKVFTYILYAKFKSAWRKRVGGFSDSFNDDPLTRDLYDVFEGKEKLSKTFKVIKQLSVRQREVLVSIALDGLSIRETAERLNTSVFNVDKTMQVARNTIRNFVEGKKKEMSLKDMKPQVREDHVISILIDRPNLRNYQVKDLAKEFGLHPNIIGPYKTKALTLQPKRQTNPMDSIKSKLILEPQNWSEYKPDSFSYNGRWIKNWFSNMVITPILIDEVRWPSVENYYQAQKTINTDIQNQFLKYNPSQAKRFGNLLTIREDWDDIKFDVMYKALQAKAAQHSKFAIDLVHTNNQIVEWNNWGDKIWGVTVNDNWGINALGQILTLIKDFYGKINYSNNNP